MNPTSNSSQTQADKRVKQAKQVTQANQDKVKQSTNTKTEKDSVQTSKNIFDVELETMNHSFEPKLELSRTRASAVHSTFHFDDPQAQKLRSYI